MIQVKDFMVKDVMTLSKEENVYAAAEIMVGHSMSCLVVMDKQKPVGLITERSIVANVLLKKKDPKKTKVSDAMHDIAVMAPNERFFSLAEFMRKNNVRRVVIVDKGKLVGLVTETDVVKTSIKLSKEIEDKDTKPEKKQVLMDKLRDVQQGLRKIDTGYKDLNNILRGGFPFNKSIMLEGQPGSGKGLVGFNFMKTGLESNNNVIYICMNELVDDIKELFNSMGVDVDKHSDSFKLINLYSEVLEDPTRIYGEEDKLLVKDFAMIRKEIMGFIKDSPAQTRCVVNVISQSLVMYDPKVVYKFVLMLNDLLKKNGITTIYFMHKGDESTQQSIPLEEVMDGAMDFQIKKEGAILSRTITLKKMKPEFSILPQFFSYEFDRNRNLTIKRLSMK